MKALIQAGAHVNITARNISNVNRKPNAPSTFRNIRDIEYKFILINDVII